MKRPIAKEKHPLLKPYAIKAIRHGSVWRGLLLRDGKSIFECYAGTKRGASGQTRAHARELGL